MNLSATYKFLRSLPQKVFLIGVENAHSERDAIDRMLLNKICVALCVLHLIPISGCIVLKLPLLIGYNCLFNILVFIVSIYITKKGYLKTAISLIQFTIPTSIFLLALVLGKESGTVEYLCFVPILASLLINPMDFKVYSASMIYPLVLYCFYYLLWDKINLCPFSIQEQYYIHIPTLCTRFTLVVIIIYMNRYKWTLAERDLIKHTKTLKDNADYYHVILDNIPIDLVTFDKNLTYSFINKHAVKDIVVRSWLIGKTNLDYTNFCGLDPEIATKREKLIALSFETKSATTDFEFYVDRFGKRKINMKGNVPILNPLNNQVIQVLGYSYDMTDYKISEENLQTLVTELEQKNLQLKQFAYITSHDLKTPLRNISSYLQILKRKTDFNEEGNELIEKAVNSVKQLNQIISDILVYTTTDNHIEVSQINLNLLIPEIKLQMDNILQENNVKFEVKENLPEVMVNQVHAYHLFLNLIGNAIKYNQSEVPTVYIGFENGFFYVEDNGIGIPEKFHQQIFEVFKRLHNQEEFEGSGIGLSLCKKIVESYKGTIEVQSVVNKGSTFKFTLPIAK